jgi:hypothetical protein
VQLAVSRKKLLGYLQGALVPYVHSQSKVKDECALQQQVCAGASETSHLRLASWDTARTCMREILAEAVRDGSSSVPISNVKRLFRTRCDLELSETTLGHTKLTDLLQDARFSDICTVQLQAQGYMVVPATGTEDEPFAANPDAPRQPPRVIFCENEPLCFEDEEAEASVESSSSPPSRFPCLSPSVLCKDGTVGQIVHNTFIHQAAPPLTPLPGARRRASSLPKDLGSEKNAWETTCHALSFLHQAVSSECRLTSETAASNVSEAHSGRWLEAPGSCCGSPTVPQRSPTRSSADPLKLLLAECATTGSLEGRVSGDGAWPSLSEPLCSPVLFSEYRSAELGAELCQQVICEHEPLWLTEVAASPCRARPATPAVKFPCLSPTMLSNDGTVGKIVQSTFIHQVAPPTPGATARSRASSLPKDWGSDKSSYETACQALSFLHTTLNNEGFRNVAEGGVASRSKDDSAESQERQRWKPAPGRSSWPRDVENREEFLSGSFDPLKVWLSDSSATLTPDQPHLSVRVGTGSVTSMLPGEAFRGHGHNSLTVETHLAPLPSSGSRRNSLTCIGFSTSDLLPFDQVSINCGAAPCSTPEPSPLYRSAAGTWPMPCSAGTAQQYADGATLCLSNLVGGPPQQVWPGFVARPV